MISQLLVYVFNDYDDIKPFELCKQLCSQQALLHMITVYIIGQYALSFSFVIVLLDPYKLAPEANPYLNGGPPLEFINLNSPPNGVRLLYSSTHSLPKGGSPLEFINIQPP